MRVLGASTVLGLTILLLSLTPSPNAADARPDLPEPTSSPSWTESFESAPGNGYRLYSYGAVHAQRSTNESVDGAYSVDLSCLDPTVSSGCNGSNPAVILDLPVRAWYDVVVRAKFVPIDPDATARLRRADGGYPDSRATTEANVTAGAWRVLEFPLSGCQSTIQILGVLSAPGHLYVDFVESYAMEPATTTSGKCPSPVTTCSCPPGTTEPTTCTTITVTYSATRGAGLPSCVSTATVWKGPTEGGSPVTTSTTLANSMPTPSSSRAFAVGALPAAASLAFVAFAVVVVRLSRKE